MVWNKIGEIISIQAILFGLLLFVGIFNYYDLNSKTERLRRDFDDALKKLQKLDHQVDLSVKPKDDCCFKFRTNGRHRRSEWSNLESNHKGSVRGEKGDKGDRGVRGPPGLPGMKGDTGGCGCYTTPAYETTAPPTIEPRQHDCRIAMIGLPLHQAEHDTYWGFWSKDTQLNSPKYWMTEHIEGRYLYSFADLNHIRTERLTHDLSPGYYFGTGHVILNGSFIYHEAGTNKLNKFDLESQEITSSVVIPSASYESNFYLYSTNYTYFDLAVDENGLWVVYTTDGGNLVVSSLDPHDLRVRFTWRIPVVSKDFGESFIVCGKLYLIRSTTSVSTHLDSVYDLYTGEWLENRLLFKNPYQLNTMVSYNPLLRHIFSWDKGNLLIYPLLLE